MARLIQPQPKQMSFRSMPTKEVTKYSWDVYRVLTDKTHSRVYVGYADADAAQEVAIQLQRKTGDKCYVVGRKYKRKK